MRTLLICLIACLLLSACDTDSQSSGNYTLYLVRHAEKVADDSEDPDLTTIGMTRAETLASRLKNKDIRDIWSSDYQRTRKTAAPLASELGLKVAIYNPKDQGDLVAQLKNNHSNALVVGHSNTIPELARMICACDVVEMEETEYDRLIVISINDGKAELLTLTQ